MPENRRVENRVPSSDANPYLAIAASLACGYLGLVKELQPDRPIEGASHDPSFALPRSILDAVRLLEDHAGAGRHFRRDLRAHLPRHQGNRIRDVHGRDQPVGARISALERLRRLPWRAPFRRRSSGCRRETCRNIRRSTGSRRADVCVVGGGFTGLSAALHLAEAGADVVLIEANSIASGASGRNGGQIHSGLRRDVIWLEEKFGFERAKILWDMAEEAKALLRALIIRYAIACDLRAGVIETLHKASLLPDAAELVKALNERFDYDQASLLDRAGTIAALGSERFVGGILDRGGGHLDPYRFSLGLARAAIGHGATIHENTPAIVACRRPAREDAARRNPRRPRHRGDRRPLRKLRDRSPAGAWSASTASSS